MNPPAAPVLALVGPTAAGKSALAIEVARQLDGASGGGPEVVSMDSALVYRGMDIGTDKPSPEALAAVPHRLVDIADPSETLTVARFQALARESIAQIHAAGRIPLLVGGSGLYFRAVVDPLEFPPTDPAVRARLAAEAEERGAAALYDRLVALDPRAASVIDPPNVRRTIRALEVIELTGRRFSSFRTGWEGHRSIYQLTVAGLTWPREELHRRIEARVDRQIERGLVAEVQALVAGGMRSSLTSVQALGYAQVLGYLDGACTLDEAVAEIKLRTRRFARRQESWFRADPRVAWFPSDPAGAAAYLAAAIAAGQPASYPPTAKQKGTAA
ncbi:MAG TPA: tRNA (adenosine(37)-N6)-dimethylallyltransferase MiaA [Actinomycetota bacterium]|nr:tRNA (adenosine(37)-N6)-dimethylallyltransferase MiaA [Actinomycetota bacterium]